MKKSLSFAARVCNVLLVQVRQVLQHEAWVAVAIAANIADARVCDLISVTGIVGRHASRAPVACCVQGL